MELVSGYGHAQAALDADAAREQGRLDYLAHKDLSACPWGDPLNHEDWVQDNRVRRYLDGWVHAQGREAFISGAFVEECPHGDATDPNATGRTRTWLRGWDEALAEKKAENLGETS